ncbi:MAG TPA: alpha/beta hydrolase domain-containing protein [Nitriliruptorales bacterium]
MHRIVACAALALVGAVVLPIGSVPAQAQVPSPTVELLPDDVGLHGHPMWDSWFDLSEFGYEQHEFLVSGTATAADGATADFTTRILVTHPSEPADFSGTVMLDWVNVTAQFENAVNSIQSVRFLHREGWAHVHVSAQATGICCVPGLTPQTWDPVRYGVLNHPGDQFANDMFSQVAKAFKETGEVNPLGELTTEVLIAAGQSQGAIRLSDHVATTQAAGGLIDGYLIQAGGTKQYDHEPAAKVIHLLGDREGTPDDPTPWPSYRLWELAGAAHADSWIGRQQTEGQSLRLAGLGQQSREQAEALWQSAGNFGEQIDVREAVCIVNGALFPTRYAANAALWHLDNWVRNGVPAPSGPRYDFNGASLAKDEHSNTLGGVRLPPIVHPVATYFSDLCELGGISVPFTDQQLVALYGDHAGWYAQVVAASETSVDDGFLVPDDGVDLLRRACNARNRFGSTSTEPCLPAPSFAADVVFIPDLAVERVPLPDATAPTPTTGAGQVVPGLVLASAVLIGRRVRAGSHA